MIHNFLNMAHRGASKYLPDNSFESFDKAIADKADMLEMDVRKTSDGELILYHDWLVVTGKREEPDFRIPRLASHVSYKEYQNLYNDLVLTPIRLEDILRRYGEHIKLNIELKAGGYEKDVIVMLEKYDLCDRVILSSFIPWVIKNINVINNRIKTGWIIGQEQVLLLNRLARPGAFYIFNKLLATSVHLQSEIITQPVVEQFHNRNIPVYGWTVDDKAELLRLIKIGVDGIITNCPDRLHSILNSDPLQKDDTVKSNT